MHLVYLAVTALLLGNSPAFASDDTYSGDRSPPPTQQKWPEPGQDQAGQNDQADQSDQADQNDQGHPDQGFPDQDSPDQKKQKSKVQYDWGYSQSGFGYCYAFDRHGNVLDWGRPQPNIHCERVRPSVFQWGRSWNGYIYCYQWTPYWAAMNDGRPVHPNYCR